MSLSFVSCLIQITGNLLLVVFYGAILGAAAKLISGTPVLYYFVLISILNSIVY